MCIRDSFYALFNNAFKSHREIHFIFTLFDNALESRTEDIPTDGPTEHGVCTLRVVNSRNMMAEYRRFARTAAVFLSLSHGVSSFVAQTSSVLLRLHSPPSVASGSGQQLTKSSSSCSHSNRRSSVFRTRGCEWHWTDGALITMHLDGPCRAGALTPCMLAPYPCQMGTS